jgi:Fe-S cluster biogenesis protein NfuA
MVSKLEARDFQERLEQLDALLRETEQHADPAARGRLQKVVQAILELHGMGLQRLLEHVTEYGECGQEILDACTRDDVVSGLLVLHNLHPLDVEARVVQALESVRPYLRSHGGNVELLDICAGVVRLRLEGSCHHCPSSTVTMQHTVEEAIYARAPEVTTIEVEGMPEESADLENAAARVALPLV